MKAKAMRSLLLSALAATTVVAASSIGLSADANAQVRRVPHQRVYVTPYVRHDPYRAFNAYGAFDAPVFSVEPGRRDVNPLSGTPRWNASGGAS